MSPSVSKLLALLALSPAVVASDYGQELFSPVAIAVAPDIQWPVESPTSFTLTPDCPVATIDYGIERAGLPYFSVSELDGPAQIEVKYTEQYHALSFPLADGPFSYANGLSNTFRVETFNVTSNGPFSAGLIQGGQRWQTIRLLTKSSVTFHHVGLRPSIDVVEVADMPGRFDSDDDVFNAIWKLGAGAAGAACFDKGSQPAIWKIDPVMGAYVQSTRPSQSTAGAYFGNYTLDFEVNIQRGGAWWSVAGLVDQGRGIHLELVGEYPKESTFVNANTTVMPANSLLISYAYDFVNQTTVPSFLLETISIPFDVREKTWHKVKTVLSKDGSLSVSVNGHHITKIKVSDYYTGGIAVPYAGSWGFGAWQDQAAYYRNARVCDTANGTVLYEKSLTTPDTLQDYTTQANLKAVCLDGAKRDRLIWLGDFYHTSHIISASTSRFDFVKGTLNFALESQSPIGELNTSPPMGCDPKIATEVEAPVGDFGLHDYQILVFLAFYELIRATNDLTYAHKTWPVWKRQVDWLLSTIDPDDGLVHFTLAFLGPGDGSAVQCSAVQMLRGAAEISGAVGDSKSSSRYGEAADRLTSAVQKHLWNEELGVFALAPSNQSDFSVSGTGFCITSGVATPKQVARSLSAEHLASLRLGPGYKDDTTVDGSVAGTNISPNTNGFLLPALFMGNKAVAAGKLIKSLWGPMLSEGIAPGFGNNQTSSGASWEYVSAANEDPGLSLFTSLSHPWGGAATYILTEWAAGLQTVPGPDGYGYKNWLLEPETGLAMGLKRASARVTTGFGGLLSVSWRLVQGRLEVDVEAPEGTTGQVRFQGKTMALKGQRSYKVSLDS